MSIRSIISEVRRAQSISSEQQQELLQLIQQGEITEAEAEAINGLLEAIAAGEIRLDLEDFEGKSV